MLIVRDAWYAACWSTELAQRPLGRRILGRRLVLFRDANGMARALGARCPHRGADLGSGRLLDGHIQCPFHGWRFDGDGRCTRIPSQPENVKRSAASSVPSFTLREQQGVIWIWAGDGVPQYEPPRYAFWESGQGARRIRSPAELVAAPFLSMIENQLDLAHLPFVHPGTFGSDQDPLVARRRVAVDPDGRGLRVEDDPTSPWKPGGRPAPARRRWLAKLLGLTEVVAVHNRFDLGGVVYAYAGYATGTFDVLLTRFTPADDEHTWLFFETVRTRAPHLLGDWVQRRLMRLLLDEGRREASVILAAEPTDPPRVSVESDRASLAARRLYETGLRPDRASR